MVDFVERRKHPRYPMELRVTLRLGPKRKRSKAVMMDLSRGGMFLRSRQQVDLGRGVDIKFEARPSYACEAQGRVVRVMNTKMLRGFGVSFDQTNENFERFLEIVERLRPEARAEFLRQVLERVVDIK
jgi:hypothetical protein